MKNNAIVILIIITVLGLNSCKSKKDTTMAESKEPVRAETLRNMTGSITNSSLKLFDDLSVSHKNENISFSPVSLHMALGMAYTGAKGNTASQMAMAMGYNINIDNFNKEFSEYNNYLRGLAQDTTLEFDIANRIFLEKSFEIKKSYENTIMNYSSGDFELADFKNNASKEEANINKWVSKVTRNRINNIIPKNTLDSETALLLVNAIYIKAAWKYPFDNNNTREKDFFSNPDVKNTAMFMTKRQKTGVRYTKYNDKQVLELPYKSDNLSFIIILPDESNSQNINKHIPDGNEYFEILKAMDFKDVYMEIPKFKVESSFELSGNLKDMGISDAFSNADFSGISDNKNINISNIFQKVFFEVDEKGSEAAAATGIIISTTSLDINQDYINFIANRPFIFILKENKNDTPLFVGQYVKP